MLRDIRSSFWESACPIANAPGLCLTPGALWGLGEVAGPLPYLDAGQRPTQLQPGVGAQEDVEERVQQRVEASQAVAQPVHQKEGALWTARVVGRQQGHEAVAADQESHVFINAEKVDEVTEEVIAGEHSKVQARAPMERVRRSTQSAEKEETVGTNYRKTNAAMEMRRINRDSFWARAEVQQQRDHEDDMRARLNRSESIEMAAEAAVLVSQRSVNPREFFRQLSSQSPTSPRTGKPPLRRSQRSLTDTAFIFNKAPPDSGGSSPRSPPFVSPFSRGSASSPFSRATTSPPTSPDFRPVPSPKRPPAPAMSPPPSPPVFLPSGILPKPPPAPTSPPPQRHVGRPRDLRLHCCGRLRPRPPC
ncbi:hypothetical protein NHX12_000212 [Muraenolepis orangiensis]|uniref:Uncharacterized protein n=1 Tax=Muraenolepis orangiensis TaxID=630683 RepID=A0A9Q0D7W1_9TELE|nr:hypothetical protein NHX12_000212 [Muraenolepis orangiensis]